MATLKQRCAGVVAFGGIMTALASSAHGATAAEVAEHLGNCNSRDAAHAIVAGDLRRNAAALGDAIFRSGIAAANAGRGRCFAWTVAWAFPHAGVPIMVANAAFGRAGATAARRGLTAEQLFIGADTVKRTNAAYFTS